MKYLLLLALSLMLLTGCAGQAVDARCAKIYTKTEVGAGHCYK